MITDLLIEPMYKLFFPMVYKDHKLRHAYFFGSVASCFDMQGCTGTDGWCFKVIAWCKIVQYACNFWNTFLSQHIMTSG